MHMYMCKCTLIFVCIHTYVHAYTYMPTPIFICMYITSMHTYICACI